MKTVLLGIFLLSSALAWGKSSTAETGAADARPPWFVSFRAGFLFSSIDPEVDSQWDHKILESNAFSISGYYSVPQAWRQVYFYFGPEVAHFTSTEAIEGGGGTAKIESTMTQILIKGGAVYQPDFLGGNWAGFAITGVQAWGRRTSRLKTGAINRGLGTDETDMPVVLGLGAFYQITPHWKPLILFETRPNGFTHFALGLNYAF